MLVQDHSIYINERKQILYKPSKVDKRSTSLRKVKEAVNQIKKKKMSKRQTIVNKTLHKTDWATQVPLNNGGEHVCSGRAVPTIL